jgi:hypothetical protein
MSNAVRKLRALFTAILARNGFYMLYIVTCDGL